MKLTKLLAGNQEFLIPSTLSKSINITGIATNSKQVKTGNLYIAITGNTVDGRDFIDDAIKNGAVAVVAASNTTPPANNTYPLITHPNPRQAVAYLASQFYPLQPDYVVAVTGTNGKTSVAHFYQQIMRQLEHKAAFIGTTGVVAPEATLPSQPDNLTTPDAITLHQILASLAAQATQYVSMEASSHGLDQYRLDGLKLKAAAFTNLSQDHLDYHQSYSAYFKAKCQLFSRILPEKASAIINKDIPEYPKLATIAKTRMQKLITYGKKDATLSFDMDPHSHRLHIYYKNCTYSTTFPLIGEFQIYNFLAACGLALASGIRIEEIISTVPHLTSAKGRMEKVITLANGASIYIDFAHTEDALKQALLAIRPYCKGALHLIFGCGGNRDKDKRAPMGKVANHYADKVIITDDNPRNENPDAIRKAVLETCPNALEIGNRREAIAAAINRLSDEDILLIAGKGHETYQIVGNDTIPFNETEIVLDVLA